MQKIFNAIAVASGVVSLTVVGATITAYVMRGCNHTNYPRQSFGSSNRWIW